MGRRRSLLLAAALATALGASSAAPAPGAGRADGPDGEIVFVSTRATANPGEVYRVVPGGARRNLSRSPYADVALAASPRGRAFAFWSNREGPWRLMISPDGAALRSVVVGGAAGADYPPSPPVFSPDGARLLVPYLPHDAIAPLAQYAVVGLRSGPARRLTTACKQTPVWAPDARLVACVGPDLTHVSVSDLRGHVLFTVPGRGALWSADGRLAVAGRARTSVLRADGSAVTSVSGVARAWSPDGSTLALTPPGALVLARPGRPGQPHVVFTGGHVTLDWVAFTPDGSHVAFAGGIAQAQIADVAGGHPRAFKPQPFGTWSRDGRYAATLAPANPIAIAVGDGLGTRDEIVARFPYDSKGVSRLVWQGDGSALLYNSSSPDRADLWTMRADGSEQRRLTGNRWSVSEPSWNAAGSTLSYSTHGYFGDRSIVVADADGHKLSIVPATRANEPSNDGHPSWSPDGARIAVDDDVTAGVSVVTVQDGSRTPLAVDGVSPAWSPDGLTIAFMDLDDGTVWGADPNGADRRRLLPASVRKVRSLAWSPDGGELVFSTDTAIYVAVPDGKSAARLVVKARLPGRPCFSPDGGRLAFAADVATVHPYRAVSVVGVDGSGLRQLTTGPYDSSDPAWRPS